jgi:clan AA aspartic protease (TIGR02281 family)
MLRPIVVAVLLLASPAAAQTVALQSRHHNMFRADVVLDNHKVRALIDTGASYLSMCNATAKLLRLELGDSVQLSTANGVITARRATVKSVKIGPIEVRDVAAVVKGESTPCDEILVGMSVLHKLHVTIDGQTMTLIAGGRNVKAARWNEWSILATIMLLLLISLLGIRKRRRRLVLRFNTRTSFHKGGRFFR